MFIVVVHKYETYTHYEFVIERFTEEENKEKIAELIDEFIIGSEFSLTYL